MSRLSWLITIVLALTSALALRAEDRFVNITVDPAAVRLQGSGASYALLVNGQTADGRVVDLTHAASYRSMKAAVATVGERGLVRAAADGETHIEVEVAGKSLAVPVSVSGS
ncbi:MAG TPA: Ig-like domain-containing protein, partial [Gemmataceae bacterium]|nr:Ig-like domain-containing protein [Gemmataceae bacterium]